jgi:hypothetical protein
MGLDMYLKGKMYVSPYTDDKLYTELNQLTKEMGVSFPANLIEFDVGYWRKANHIHKWFVENVQDGNDDCKEYYVSLDTLKELLETCQTVLNDHSKAEELLPTESGFFFGSTDYDEFYYEDIQNTINIIEPLVSNPDITKDLSLYYHSSW